jgi:predicted glutamine amidotransferase
MCRWMAYSGDPVPADDLLFRPEHSIIDQSLHAQLGGFTTNGDGFGIGWYGDGNGTTPAVFKSTHPAWNEENLREVATQIRTPLLFAHVRASSGTPVQRSNCHPFRYGRWLWMHNGSLAGFPVVKRDLLMAVDTSLYPKIEGSTDTETLFFLALTFGLTEDPPAAVARAVGFVEQVGRRHGVEHPVHMTVATSDGESIWVFRYSSEKATSSLYYSTDVAQVRELYPELEALKRLGADARFIVSEPLRDLPGIWNEVPEGSWALVRRGEHQRESFQPFQPAVPA